VLHRMSTSQNGYTFGDSSLISAYTIVRDVKIALRRGDVSVVLLHFARWYDQHIEPLTKIDTGGYNPRFVEGSKIRSNHGSGTAEDLRWNKHPRGKKGTFTQGQKDKIHAQLKFYEGVIRWGEDYVSATIDGMHFEINKGPAEVARIAKKCKGVVPTKPNPKPTNPSPAKPEPIKVDGQLGPKTVSRWQIVTKNTDNGKLTPTFVKWLQGFLKTRVDHRLVIDGNLGPKTIGAHQRYLKSPVDQVISEPQSEIVKALQRRLNTGTF
jgi:hypothetical protein